jgi:antibiotic biosynthesis monooxygenase (ABM) superfamily enzyme
MPFGLDIKSLIVGILLAWFVIPWIQGMIVNKRTPAPASA